jgi:hypothetical protein
MAIVFVQQNKKQKTLIFILIGSLLITAFVVWYGFFREEKSATELYIEENTEASQEEIKIDFSVLKNPLLQELQPFSEIQPLGGSSTPGVAGRANPFIPY